MKKKMSYPLFSKKKKMSYPLFSKKKMSYPLFSELHISTFQFFLEQMIFFFDLQKNMHFSYFFLIIKKTLPSKRFYSSFHQNSDSFERLCFVSLSKQLKFKLYLLNFLLGPKKVNTSLGFV